VGMEMAKNSARKSVRYRQSPVITFLVIVAVIFVCVTSVVRATSLHTKSKQLAETEKTMELKVQEAKQEQADLDAQEKYMQTNEYIEDVAKDKLGLVHPDELVIRPSE
jgi:cell division protein DivIC